MILRLYLDEAYDLTVLSEGYSYNCVCGEAGKHATSSVNLQVRPFLNGNNIVNKIINKSSNITAEIIDDDIIFTGIIRPYLNVTSLTSSLENLQLEVMDMTEAMHLYISDPSTEGKISGHIYPEVKKGVSLKYVVSYLFSLCNINVNVEAVSDDIVSYFKLPPDEYLDEVVERFLYEYGYDFKFDNRGNAVIFNTYIDDTSIAGDIDDAINSISLERSDDSYDGLNLRYKKYGYSRNVRLLKFNTGNMGFNQLGLLAMDLTGKLYSGFMHDKHFNAGSSIPDGNLWNWNFENSGIMISDKEKLSAKDVLYVETDISKIKVNLYDESGVTFSPVLQSYDENGARFWVDYSGRFNVNLDLENGWAGWTWNVEVYGDVGYALSEEYSYSVNGPNPESFDFEYLIPEKDNDTIKQTIAKKYYNRQKLSKISYEFNSKTKYDVGNFYTLIDNVGGRSQKIRLISRKLGNDNIYHYRAEGAGTISDHPVSIVNESKSYTASTSNGKTAYEIAVENGFEGTESQWVESLKAKDFSVVFSPSIYIVEPRKGGIGSIVCTVSRINGLEGNITAAIYDASSGYAIESEGDILTISYANSINTSTSFKIDITVGEKKKTFMINGQMKDSIPKTQGWFDSMPDESLSPEKFIKGDTCLINGNPYLYDGTTWNALTIEGLEALPYQTVSDIADCALNSGRDITESMSVMYAYIGHLYARSALIDRIRTSKITMEGNGIIKSKNVADSDIKDAFLPSAGYALDGNNGRLQATKAYIKNSYFDSVEVESSDVTFGSSGTFVSSVSWPQFLLSAWQLMMFCFMVWPESPYQPKKYTGTATVNGYSVSNGYIRIDPVTVSTMFYTSYPSSAGTTPYIKVRGNEGDSKSYVSINGGSESVISSGNVNISFVAARPACAKNILPWSARYSGYSASTIGSPMHPMDSVISTLGVFTNIIIGGFNSLNDGSYYLDNKMSEGSVKLPGGIILKWAKLSSTGGESAEWRVWNYAYPFPTNCIMAFSVIEKSDQNRDAYAYGYPMCFDQTNAAFSAWKAFNSYAIALGY